MNHSDAYTMARELMNRHGLETWGFAWHNRRRSLGTCNYQKRTIYLSKPLTAINPVEVMRNTVLHEIAHAKAGPAAGHGRMWQLMAIQVGADPVACSAVATTVPGKYQAKCPNCGYVSHKYRKPKSGKRVACSACCQKYNMGRWSDRYELNYSVTN